MSKKSLFVSLLAVLFASGCATIFGSSSESLTMQSDPPGATYQYGPYQGKTPDTISVDRGSLSHFAMFSKAGYSQKTVPVETGIRGVTWVDILFWPGFIIDFGTGNAYKVNSPVVNAVLEPVAQAPAQSDTARPQPSVKPAAEAAPDQPKGSVTSNPNVNDQWKASGHDE